MKKQLLRTMLLLFALVAGSSSVWAADKWVKTGPADLQTGDVVVLVDLTSGKAMSNNNGTSSAPSAVEVTVEEDEITSTVESTIQWTVTASGTGDERTYQLSTGESYLYVTATNNGVRVGSGERNTFKIATGGDNDGYYLNNTATEGTKTVTRYIGCYNSSSWRCYTSINSNIKANNNAFFKKVAGSTPTCEKPTFSPAGGSFITAQNVTISTETEGATIYYTTDGNSPTTSSSVYSAPIAVSTTTTIKAIAVKDGYDNSSEATATYTITTPYNVADAIAYIETLGTATSAEDIFVTGIVSQIDSYNGNYKSITYWISDDGTTTNQMQVYSGKSLKGDDFAAQTDLVVGDVVMVKGKVKMYNNTTPEFDRNSQIESLEIPATISAAGYATFSRAFAVDFSATSLEVYTAQVNGAKNGVVLNEVASKKVPANTAVILKGETAAGAVIATADALENNDLVAGPVTGDGASYYALGKEGEKVGFGILADDTKLPANKAYIPASKFGASAPAFMPFSFGGEVTGVSQIENGELRIENVYDLQGRRVAQPTKGLYIVNGKKVVLK